eukprot:1070101_1
MYATAIEHCRKCGMTLDALNKIIRWREHPEFVGQQYQKHHRCIDNNGHDTVLCPEVQSPSRSEDWSSLLSWDVSRIHLIGYHIYIIYTKCVLLKILKNLTKIKSL